MRLVAALCLLLLTSPASGSTRVQVRAYGYCECSVCCDGFADGKTATGRNAQLAGVAVDPKVIPLGSRVDIPGYTRGTNGNGSWILADDVGGAIKGNVIDVRFKTHAEARAWGVRVIWIRVWKPRAQTKRSYSMAQHLCECDNCGNQYQLPDRRIRLEDVDDLTARMDPGGEVPVGECPACGALCYLVRELMHVS